MIIPVGGAEDKTANSTILTRFVNLCGGQDARIAVVPTASIMLDTGQRYERVFRTLGAGDVRVVNFERRDDANKPELVRLLEDATGVFMTGGNQLRLSTILGGTDAARVLRRINAEGSHIAGTSAGAGFMSEHMIAFGEEGSTPISGKVTLAPGLGLSNRVVVDQHFRQRDRLGRLLTAISYNPFMVGIGLDENTAAFIDHDDVLEVVGSGAITVVDGSSLGFSSISFIQPGAPVCITNLKVHVLIEHAKYNLHLREPDVSKIRFPEE
jgi:cyanophycinase